ncbi:hypothetical protein MFIFM68171_08166 [Madurella fahalii]|uniref:Heterokaryon incompatibility domain-containing protein n=1 Tax=Madurella fahalii TaxID=1157608 RepID=A0ABQ0GJL2_9PEZI
MSFVHLDSIFSGDCSECRFEINDDEKRLCVWDQPTTVFKEWEMPEIPSRVLPTPTEAVERLADAARGCKRCALLCSLLHERLGPLDSNARYADKVMFPALTWDGGTCHFWPLAISNLNVRFMLYPTDRRGPNPYNLGRGQNMPGKTSSESTFKTIRGWITDCIANHNRCKRLSEDGPFSPDRVLDLRCDKIRLVDGLKCQQYACLSHCWGPPEKLTRMTHANLRDFQNEIPPNALTKTFRDAIDIARRLRIDFIWIDALCIIQDSEDDWRTQSALMAEIYENAFLTIFASKARESSEGCYHDYSNTDVGQEVGGLENVSMRLFTDEDLYPYAAGNSFYQLQSRHWPLLNRAWVFQEQRLSRRRLHFAGKGVFWHCDTRIVSESGSHDEYTPETPLVEKWTETINRYTSMKLTVETDRLIALAGIVKRMQAARPGDRYLAGLWESTLLTDLAWKHSRSSKRNSEARSKMRAVHPLPSFSWVPSNAREPYWNHSTNVPLNTATVLEVHYTPLGPVEFGQPAEAHITIKSPVIQGTLKPVRPPPGNHTHDVMPLEYALEIGLPDFFGLARSEPRSDLFQEIYPDYSFDAPGDKHLPFGSQVLVMFTACSMSTSYNGRPCSFSGVVMKERRDGWFERVGAYNFQSRRWGEHFLRCLESFPARTITLV